MEERTRRILAASGLTQDSGNPSERAAQKTLSQADAERIERARRERITKFWTEKGVLPLLNELAAAIGASQLTIDESQCYLRFNQKGVETSNSGFSYDYLTVHVEADSFKVQGVLGGQSDKRNPNAGRLNINGKVVGRDGDLESVLAYALAHPSHFATGSDYMPNYF